MVLYKVNQVFRYSPFRVDVSSAALPCNQSENSAESYSSGSSQSLERWGDFPSGLCFPAQSCKCPSTHPEVACKFIDAISGENIFKKNLHFGEDRAFKL